MHWSMPFAEKNVKRNHGIPFRIFLPTMRICVSISQYTCHFSGIVTYISAEHQPTCNGKQADKPQVNPKNYPLQSVYIRFRSRRFVTYVCTERLLPYSFLTIVLGATRETLDLIGDFVSAIVALGEVAAWALRRDYLKERDRSAMWSFGVDGGGADPVD